MHFLCGVGPNISICFGSWRGESVNENLVSYCSYKSNVRIAVSLRVSNYQLCTVLPKIPDPVVCQLLIGLTITVQPFYWLVWITWLQCSPFIGYCESRDYNTAFLLASVNHVTAIQSFYWLLPISGTTTLQSHYSHTTVCSWLVLGYSQS